MCCSFGLRLMALETIEEYNCFKNNSNGDFPSPIFNANKDFVSIKLYKFQFLVLGTLRFGQQAQQMELVVKTLGVGVQVGSFFTRKYRLERGTQVPLATKTARPCFMASRNHLKFTTPTAATFIIQFAK